MFKGVNRHISSFEKTTEKPFNIAFLLDIVKVRSSKLCMIITLLMVYIVIVGLITFTLFQGHMYARNINFKLFFLDSCLDLSAVG